MPLNPDIRKVMVIGSGPIVIGQAAEFDYAGSQACRAIRELGLQVVLVNSNPATIMTDPAVADRVYIEPLTADSLEKILRLERPDGILPTLGGQTGLNLAVELHESGILEEVGTRILGTPIEAIRKAEDRELFRDAMTSIGQPVIESRPVSSVDQAVRYADLVGLPLVVRPAFTLGGSGGGIARSRAELESIVSRGLSLSPIRQVLLERTVAGWKEIEYEVVRDAAGNCVTVCNMENVDPMGIHTGDSIVVAPSQTLSDRDYQMLRNAALSTVDALGIEGGCNIQFALHPESDRYYVIEVNPRLSRSSALASKASGYPIAKVATKIALGLRLDEIVNPVTGNTFACFEPALDYVVVKIPRWPFDKFPSADRTLGTQMKATGEVMAIDRTFEGALIKALRSLENGPGTLLSSSGRDLTVEELKSRLATPTDERLFAVAEAFRRGWHVEEVHELTGIDRFFLRKIASLVEIESGLSSARDAHGALPLLLRARKAQYTTAAIARLSGLSEEDIAESLENAAPSYKMVDTCAGEFEACTPYYYSTYSGDDEAPRLGDNSVVVVGSGPIRIGQGIEFDYCCVHAALALRKEGFRTIMINNNPETVSTDFDVSDRLYFEPVSIEDVMNVVRKELPIGVMIQFGGQTAINLAAGLAARGVPILGTQAEGIDLAEDRERFDRLLAELDIPRPPGGTAYSVEEGERIARDLGFPVLVRPSYVLAGRAMEIMRSLDDLRRYLGSAVRVTPDHPVLIDRYVEGREVEVDAICDGVETLICGVMEHVEQAGVHSGDSIAVYPPVSLSEVDRSLILEYTSRICGALRAKGLVNIQFVIDDSGNGIPSSRRILVIEANPRASRTVPFLSKATGVPLVDLAVGVSLGRSLRGLGFEPGVLPEPRRYAVKAPVFSFGKMAGLETSLGPEMKSTGEVMGIGHTPGEAMAKALAAAGVRIQKKGLVLMSVADRDKPAASELARGFLSLGYELVATPRTAERLRADGLPAASVPVDSAEPSALGLVASGRVSFAVVTPNVGKDPTRAGFVLRRALADYGIPTVTSIATAAAVLMGLKEREITPRPL